MKIEHEQRESVNSEASFLLSDLNELAVIGRGTVKFYSFWIAEK